MEARVDRLVIITLIIVVVISSIIVSDVTRIVIYCVGSLVIIVLCRFRRCNNASVDVTGSVEQLGVRALDHAQKEVTGS